MAETSELIYETSELSYEQAREELVRVVHTLETGGAPLAESMALWERGEHLADVCQGWLDGAREKIDLARSKVDAES
ncbi:MAG TPA: exodeoxyribonuclease VII small subunit [Propionibacteriaceae bacterium]|nr:exodeoxyribonuclease VII small subunit [Propionibacteriaceae bacterium]